MCFVATMDCLYADDWFCVPVLLHLGEASSAGCYMKLGGADLGFRWRHSWDFSSINTPCSQNFSDDLTSWTQLSIQEVQGQFLVGESRPQTSHLS